MRDKFAKKKKKRYNVHDLLIFINFILMEAENINTKLQTEQPPNIDYNSITDNEKKFLKKVFIPYFVINIISVILSILRISGVFWILIVANLVMLFLLIYVYLNKNITFSTQKIITGQVNAILTWYVLIPLVMFLIFTYSQLAQLALYTYLFNFWSIDFRIFILGFVIAFVLLLVHIHNFLDAPWKAGKWQVTKYWLVITFFRPKQK